MRCHHHIDRVRDDKHRIALVQQDPVPSRDFSDERAAVQRQIT
jgi:hypothetical protein